MKWLRKCVAGGHYTFEETCHGNATHNPHPAKFNPLERHASYRRQLKGLQ